jgi:hypothetical protein
MSFEVTVTPTVYNVEVEVNPSVQPFDVQVITGNVPDLNLTTNGDSGASTFDPLTGELNIPEYTLDGLGGVPESRTITINGVEQDLSADRTFTIPSATPVTIGSPANGLAIDVNQVLTIGLASGSTNGALSSTDWSTFNGKQPAIGYTPENVANKAINLTSPDDTKYPTTLAVSTALAGKQNTLTNPITGTGTSGQVAFWSGTGTQTGSNNLFWDNANGRLGINVLSTEEAIRVSGTGRIGNLLLRNTNTGDAGTGKVIWADNAGSGVLGLNSSTALTINTANVSRIYVQNNGNIGINTTTDAGFRLDVNGTARLNGLTTIQGTTASDSGQLGAELLTTGTGDASWTGSSFATGYTHVAGSTTTLTSTLAGVVNTFYQITYTVTGRTAGSFTIAFGGFTSGNLTATGAVGPRATTTDTLVITPTSDFNGTIVLSIRVISASSASVSFSTSAGVVTNEIRISNVSVNNTQNTFFGSISGQRNTTGAQNVGIGRSAISSNTTGSQNTAIGHNSLSANTIGGINTAIGANALLANTTGGGNVAVGVNALVGTTTGNSNIGIGNFTLQNQTTANQNIAIGELTLFNLTSGSANTSIGHNSGRLQANGSSTVTIANNSVFLGANTRANADNETNQIVIGHTAIGLGSNTTVIGNSSTTFGRWWGNLLIGTSTNQASSVLTMESTTRGFLPPRMTSTERNAIATPATGLVVYNTTDNRLSVYNGTAWVNLATV